MILTRRSTRLPSFDYSQDGAYFITLVAHHRASVFGEIAGGEMRLNPLGEIVKDSWLWLQRQYPYVETGEFTVMPNHFHGILFIIRPTPEMVDPGTPVGAAREPPLPDKVKPLGGFVGAFKTVSTKKINLLRQTPGAALWQRNYHDRIIRNARELESISLYILNNPINWELDHENPSQR